MWITRGILNNDNITIIEECVSNIYCPIDIGRLQLKISFGFAEFTACLAVALLDHCILSYCTKGSYSNR